MFELSWQAPYDWPWMWGFLQARAVAGIERFEAGRYTRSFEYDGHRGVITMTPDETRQVLCITLSEGLLPVAHHCLTRISHLLDLKCEPHAINDTLGTLASARPGLRLPGAMNAFEQGVRAILGQLVSVSMAAKLTGKVVTVLGDPLPDYPGFYLFPRPEQLMNADPQQLKSLGMPLKRAESLIYLASAALSGELPLNAPEDIEQGMKTLQSFPGIGRWTANYFALRGWQASDVFLPEDYLIKQRFPGMTPAQIRRYAERWQPWRSYALLHIWYTEGWAP